MRIDVCNAACSHAVIRLRPLRRSFVFVPCRTFISRTPNPEDEENIIDVVKTHFHLIDPRLYNRRPHPNPDARNIAVIGGGITGLSTAFFVSKEIPNAKITIFEQNERLGGWLDSEKVEVDGGEVLFEWGPRSLRPDNGGAGQFTRKLLWQVLDNYTGIIGISKNAKASRNRFVYYGERLVRMPGPGDSMFRTVVDTISKLITEPIFKGLVPSFLAETTKPLRSPSVRDESVGDFVRRRFGTTIADNLTSALFHGIYAGNIDKLSARTLLPKAWYLETRDTEKPSGVLWNMGNLYLRQHFLHDYRLRRGTSLNDHTRIDGPEKVPDYTVVDRLQHIAQVLHGSSMYTFVGGLQDLSNAIISKLSENPNITFSTSTTVKSLDYNTDKRSFTINTLPSVSTRPDPAAHPSNFDYIIATIRPSALLPALATSPTTISIPEKARRSIAAVSRTVNVMVVNLYYQNPNLLPPDLEGFGYLIPASVDLHENPERALGVIFSSNASGPRGPAAIRRVPRSTAEELQSLRENMERKYESDYDRQRKIELLEKYKQRSEDNPDHVDNDPNVHGTESGNTVIKAMETDLMLYEAAIQYEIKKLIKLEKEARKREQEPGFDPEENYDEIRLGQDTATGTKLAVMLGGHWWDSWEASDLPSEEDGIEKAKSLLKRHLNITNEPEVAKARLQRDCIPQYPVGYRDYMATVHRDVLAPIGGKFDGRLKVAGSWYQGGVGVNDCVRKAKETAVSVYEGWDECTGAEEYVGDEKWCLVDRRTGEIKPDMMCLDR